MFHNGCCNLLGVTITVSNCAIGMYQRDRKPESAGWSWNKDSVIHNPPIKPQPMRFRGRGRRVPTPIERPTYVQQRSLPCSQNKSLSSSLSLRVKAVSTTLQAAISSLREAALSEAGERASSLAYLILCFSAKKTPKQYKIIICSGSEFQATSDEQQHIMFFFFKISLFV